MEGGGGKFHAERAAELIQREHVGRVVVADCARVTEDEDDDSAPQKPADKSRPTVTQKLRLDNRVLDLRTIANQGIFRIQSKIGQFFREFLYQHGFQEIHTPKLTRPKVYTNK